MTDALPSAKGGDANAADDQCPKDYKGEPKLSDGGDSLPQNGSSETSHGDGHHTLEQSAGMGDRRKSRSEANDQGYGRSRAGNNCGETRPSDAINRKAAATHDREQKSRDRKA